MPAQNTPHEQTLEERLGNDKQFAEVLAAFETKNFESAAKLIDNLASTYESKFEYQALRGKIYANLASQIKIPETSRNPDDFNDFDEFFAALEMIENLYAFKYNTYSEAIKAHTKAVEIKQDADELMLLGITYYERYLFTNAESDALNAEKNYLCAIAIEPKKTDAYALLGGLYFLAGNNRANEEREQFYKEAREYFGKALELDKTNQLKFVTRDYVHDSLKELNKGFD